MALVLLTSLLAGCAVPAAQPAQVVVETGVVPVTVEVPVKETVVVEAPAPAAAVVEAAPVASSPMTVTFVLSDPTGMVEVTELHAPRLDTLEGKTVCELSDDSWQAHRTFPALRELLQQQYPTVTVIPFTEFPLGTAQIDLDSTAQLTKDKGCDAVIVGNAG
jgi:hypothetical protein